MLDAVPAPPLSPLLLDDGVGTFPLTLLWAATLGNPLPCPITAPMLFLFVPVPAVDGFRLTAKVFIGDDAEVFCIACVSLGFDAGGSGSGLETDVE